MHRGYSRLNGEATAMRDFKLLFALTLMLGAGGCETLQQDSAKVAHEAGKAANGAAQSATSAYRRMQHYLAEKDLLKTFTDASEHGEEEVLAQLHRARALAAGRNKGKPPPPAGAAPTSPSTQPYTGNYRWPVDACIVSSLFGERWGRMHKGMDLAADAGEPVYAVADGEVIYAGDGLRGYGNVVILQHEGRVSSLYAHNSELKVRQGDHVTRGTLIALLGSTGHSTGPHVHFEIREGDTAVDPMTVLPKSSFAMAPGLHEPAVAMAQLR